MSDKEWNKIIKDLPYGAKTDLATHMGCDPTKISKALRGFIKNERFMARLQAKAKTLVATKEAAAS